MFATHSGPHVSGIVRDYKKKGGTTVAVEQCGEKMAALEVKSDSYNPGSKKIKEKRNTWSKEIF